VAGRRRQGRPAGAHLRSYEDVLRLYVRDVIGTTVLSRLTPLAIQEVYTKMRDDKLSARTIRYAHAVLSSA